MKTKKNYGDYYYTDYDFIHTNQDNNPINSRFCFKIKLLITSKRQPFFVMVVFLN